MKTVRILMVVLAPALAVLVWPAEVSKAEPMGSAWTYQGRLMDANSPANGLYDLQFKLYDSPSDGNQLASIIDINELDVMDGYLTVLLDFGSDVFIGNACWLEIGVRQGELNDPNGYTTLSPRQQITPAPYALGYLNPLSGLETASSSATGNTFYGTGAGASNTTGNYNSFFGYQAGNKNTTGSWNTFSGGGAGYYNTTGNSNTFSGRYAGYSNSIGSYNTFSGHQAGYSARGSGNTFLGRYAGYSNTTGNGNVFIGYQAGYSETGSNKLYIANSSGTPLIYGDFSTGRVGIGPTSPAYKLDVSGDIRATGTIYGSVDNADKLDGQHGSYYNNWTNLTNVPAGFADGVDNTGGITSESDTLNTVCIRGSSTSRPITINNTAYPSNNALYAVSTSTTNPTIWAETNNNNSIKAINNSATYPTLYVVQTGSNWAGWFVGGLGCTGTKSATVKTQSYGNRNLYADESAEIYFFDRGSSRLTNGRCIINLDRMFLETVTINDSYPMLVQITLTADCKGVFVSEKTNRSFTVREIQSGASNATFDWEVAAKRKGYEDIRMEKITIIEEPQTQVEGLSTTVESGKEGVSSASGGVRIIRGE